MIPSRLLRGLVLLSALLAAMAPASGAIRMRALDGEDLARIETYLNGIGSLRAGFLQIAPDGSTSTGTLYYERPDKMRLDYDPPSEILIIANGWELVYYDRRLEQVSNLFVSSTPLAFLLEDEIELSGGVTVTRAERVENELHVSLVQTEEPDQGEITLMFEDQPLGLRRWAVTDPQGLTTHVILEQVQTGVAIDDSLFKFRNPRYFPADRN